MAKRPHWFDRTKNIRPCKIGSIPTIVQLHGSDLSKVEPGGWVRVREAEGKPWTAVLVRRVMPDGYFQADR